MAAIDPYVQSIATTIADYRQGAIERPDEAHVRCWIEQFESADRLPVLRETAHLLGNSYVSAPAVEGFVDALMLDPHVVGHDARAFWAATCFLSLQTAGNSQRDMLAIVDRRLQHHFGLTVARCGQGQPARYLYIDDFLYSGGRIKHDLKSWIAGAPPVAELFVVVMGWHTYGQYSADQELTKAATAAGKRIALRWHSRIVIEDRQFRLDSNDVLRPTAIPADAAVQAYVARQETFKLRRPGNPGPLRLYSSDAGKIVLEQALWKAGVALLDRCPYLKAKPQMRPLGATFFHGAGFGSPFVTYRNCANNTPLVFWAGDPWYPLLPRITN